MWLLLSTAGRIAPGPTARTRGSRRTGTKARARSRAGQAGSLTPLVFEVENFSADKSAGKSPIDAKYTLKVSVRGQRQAGPISRVPMQIALVRGPDKMWYLENGTLGRSLETRSPVHADAE